VAARIEEDDPYPVVAWANILRKNGQSAKAADLFLQRYEKIKAKKNRAYFFEWGVTQREIKNYCYAVWLCSISLSDWAMAGEWHGKYVPLMMRFAELSISFIKLQKKTADSNDKLYNPAHAQTFLDACAATAKFGLESGAQENMPPDYDWKKSERSLKEAEHFGKTAGAANVEVRDGFNFIREAIILAWELRDTKEDKRFRLLPKPAALSFQDMGDIMGVQAKQPNKVSTSEFTKPKPL
jgi:hypothetical protein